jgi:TrkA domain protein
MTTVHETQLPGVGIRYDFVTRAGDQLGIIAHRTDRFDLLIYDRDDPDSCSTVLRLDPEDAHTLTELLGGTQVAQSQVALQQALPGLTIDWVPIRGDWTCAGRSIEELAIRTRTGVSVVAIVREGKTIPSPSPDSRLMPGDTVVVVGTPEAIRRTFDLLESG